MSALTPLPVTCDNGHEHETTKVVALSGSAKYTTSGVRVGPVAAPCPECGAGGRIPAGTYYGPEARR
jgi:hypothetical protein